MSADKISFLQHKVLEAVAEGRNPNFDGPQKHTIASLLKNGWVEFVGPKHSVQVFITNLGREVLTWPPVLWRKP